MALIKIDTIINAPIEVCFDLSRSIDLHIKSMEHTGEIALAGKTSGLIKKGETVTWEAKHFLIKFKMTMKITAMERNSFFVDEQIIGPFSFIKHIHSFQTSGNGTLMSDSFAFRSPYGLLGRIVDVIILKSYMKKLIIQRNLILKVKAENLAVSD